MCKVISRGTSHRDQLCERIAACLSGLGLYRVEDRVFAVEDQIMKVTDDDGAFAKRKPFPAKLRFLRSRYGIANLARPGRGDYPNYFISCGISNFDSVSLSAKIMTWMSSCYNPADGQRGRHAEAAH
jgi:hypothetical protein